MTHRDDDDSDTGENAVRPTPGIPGMTRDEARVIEGDTPDDPAPEEDDDDPSAPFDAEAGPLGIADDDTVGADDADDAERERGSTEA